MLAALSTGHEIGLALVGAAFIGFSLLSSFVFPRMVPDFPTRRGMRWYIPLAVCFFAAMLSAVIVFGREKSEASTTSAAAPAGTTGTTGTTASTTPSSATSQYAGGNAAAGKSVFTSAGCVACHTFTPAGSKGTIGPNLDSVASYAAKAHESLDDFLGGAITHPPPPYVPPGFANVMPTTFGSSLSATQIKDLVAFLAGSGG